jgi:uncharacterized membrane protein
MTHKKSHIFPESTGSTRNQAIHPILRFRAIAVAAMVALAAAQLHAADATFTGLGSLNEAIPASGAMGVSPDGSVIVGQTNSATDFTVEAFRWTSSGGMAGLGLGAGNATQAYGVSSFGSVVVGDIVLDDGSQAFRWTQDSGVVTLGDLPGGGSSSLARAVSADGSTIVGQGASESGLEAFKWTAGGGMTGLGDLPGGSFFSFAYDASADGAVIVGESDSTESTCFACAEAVVWTADGDMIGLGDLPGGVFRSSARGVSADGQFVVGQGFGESGGEAFIWTQDTGMSGLGSSTDAFTESIALDVSADGSVVVGFGATDTGQAAFIWDATSGMRVLQEVLTADFGLDLDGWRLQTATAISDDGRVITGIGINPSGATEAWIAQVPEPSIALLLSVALLALSRRYKKRRRTGRIRCDA